LAHDVEVSNSPSVSLATGPDKDRAVVRARTVAAWSAFVMAFAAPVLGIVAAATVLPTSPPELATTPHPTITQAWPVDVAMAVPAKATLTWQPGPVLVAPTWNGLVTEVYATADRPIRDGSALVRIDGVDRLAIATPRPFHRNLRLGDRGADVVMLREVLDKLGIGRTSVTSERFDAALQSNVMTLERRLAGPTVAIHGDFRPEWFVWMPAPEVTAQSVIMHAGSPAPPPGAPLVTATPTLAGVKVSPAGSDRLRGDTKYSFVVNETAVPLSDALTATGSAAAALSTAVKPGQETVDGQVSVTDRRGAVGVPLTAVVVGQHAELCVIVVTASKYQPRPVEVSGGDMGFTEITRGLAAGESILVNPNALGQRC
jgi:hypothetical protein